MPNKKNAKKALRQSKKRWAHNQRMREDYRDAVKGAKKAIESKDAKSIADSLKLAQKKLAKAAKKNVIKKGTLARKISRLMKKAVKVSK